jgi:hypothetical protein
MRLTVDGRYLIYRKTCGTMTDELMVQTHKQAFAQIVKSSPILSSHVLPIIPRRTGGKCIPTATTLASGLPAKLAGIRLIAAGVAAESCTLTGVYVMDEDAFAFGRVKLEVVKRCQCLIHKRSNSKLSRTSS